MTKLPPIELIETDNPLEWAIGHLKLIGSGDTAYVFEHPDNHEIVIRVSDYPDGWFLYAENILSNDEIGERSPFHPHVHWIGCKDDTFIGISEKLEEIKAGDELEEAINLIHEALIIKNDDAWEKINQILPGFQEFSKTLYKNIDLKDGNIMKRGDQLVINDPLRGIPHAIVESFKIRNNYLLKDLELNQLRM